MKGFKTLTILPIEENCDQKREELFNLCAGMPGNGIRTGKAHSWGHNEAVWTLSKYDNGYTLEEILTAEYGPRNTYRRPNSPLEALSMSDFIRVYSVWADKERIIKRQDNLLSVPNSTDLSTAFKQAATRLILENGETEHVRYIKDIPSTTAIVAAFNFTESLYSSWEYRQISSIYQRFTVEVLLEDNTFRLMHYKTSLTNLLEQLKGS